MAPRSTSKKSATGKPAKSDNAAAQSDESLTETLRLRDLVDRVVATTGGKKSEVKQTAEAILSEILAALDGGATLNLPPLGKIRVARPGDAETGQPMVLKLRRAGVGKAKQPLADADEAG